MRHPEVVCLKANLDILASVAREIESRYRLQLYDHRPFLTYKEPHPEIKAKFSTESFRIHYACFRRCIATVLQPHKIVEIGVRTGVSALAFLNGAPGAEYLGIDSNLDGIADSVNYLGVAEKWFKHFAYHTIILVHDSQQMTMLPNTADFIHIDGCHTRAGAAHDVTLALDRRIPWILVDDTNVESVHSGVMDAICDRNGVALHEFKEVVDGSILLYYEEQER